jgi:hypothetical protein
MKEINCGFYRLLETTVFHYAGYECAAWWQKVQVPAGDYPVRALLQEGRIQWFLVTLPGVIVADNFQPLFCGNRIGDFYDETQNAGKPGAYHIQTNDYIAFQSVHEDSNSPWHLDLSVLPDLHNCVDCGCIVSRSDASWDAIRADNRRCPHCGVVAQTARRGDIKRRHGFLIRAIEAAGHHVTRYASIFDFSLDEYLQSNRTDSYYKKSIQQAIERLRTYRRLKKDPVVNGDALRRMAWSAN